MSFKHWKDILGAGYGLRLYFLGGKMIEIVILIKFIDLCFKHSKNREFIEMREVDGCKDI